MADFGEIAGSAGALTGFFQMGGGFLASLLAGIAFANAHDALVILMPALAALTVIFATLQLRRR
jgi:DHA1 family bicyclomycin/chloramphenicol resistance-like MFS transporter